LRYPADCWYDGPRVSRVCEEGAKRLLPHLGMTLQLNLGLYAIVIAVLIMASFLLPRKSARARPAPVTQAQPAAPGQ
jgi:hypothetical protein